MKLNKKRKAKLLEVWPFIPYIVSSYKQCFKSSDFYTDLQRGLINLLILRTVLYCVLFLRGTFSFSFFGPFLSFSFKQLRLNLNYYG